MIGESPAATGYTVRSVRGWPASSLLRQAYRRQAVWSCEAVHRAILATNCFGMPANLALKHVFDYRPYFVPPAAIQYRVPTAVKRSESELGPTGRLRYMARRFDQGGTWKSCQLHFSRNFQGRFLLGGDWDLSQESFDSLPSVVAMFHDHQPYWETAEYAWMSKKIESNDFRWTKGCTSMSDVHEYFQYLVRVHDDIRDHGYRTQRQLGIPGDDEIRVCIDRAGKLCIIGGGTHRLSIAKVLGVPSVPVLVKRVHLDWVRQFRGHYDDVVIAVDRELCALADASKTKCGEV